MSTAFPNPVVHACQPGWHGAPGVAAALSISPWVLALWFPPRQVRCWMKEKCCVSSGDKGKMEKRAGPFLLRGTEQTHTQSHHSCNVVLGRLCDGKMASPTPSVLPSEPTPPAHMEGSPSRVTEKNKAIHCCFTPGTAKPQPHHSWLLTLSSLQVCVTHRCVNVWYKSGVGGRRERGCSLGFVMCCSKKSKKD